MLPEDLIVWNDEGIPKGALDNKGVFLKAKEISETRLNRHLTEDELINLCANIMQSFLLGDFPEGTFTVMERGTKLS